MASSQVIVINEVRVLSGLSRGAALPFDSAVVIGSSPECELFLMDPGVAEQHFRLDIDSGGRVTVVDLTNADPKPVEQPESTPFRAGDVELVWCGSDRSWDTIVTANPDSPVSLEAAGSALGVDVQSSLRPKRLWIGGALATVVVVLAAASWMSIGRSSGPPASSPQARIAATRKASAADLANLRSKMEQALSSRSFIQLTVATMNNGLSITGSIRTDQHQELETLIQSWKKENASLRIALKLADSVEAALPFEIVAMVGGSAPSVLASTGQTLYQGSESDGYRLVLMNGVCLTFEHIETHQRLKQCLDQSLPHR